MAMTKTHITPMPSAMRGKSPRRRHVRDVAAQAAAPRSVVSPQVTYSATMLAFHEPPLAVMAPVTKLGNTAGSR